MATVTDLGAHLGIDSDVRDAALRGPVLPCRRPRPVPQPRPASPRALSPAEQATVLAMLHEPRFVDLAPAEVYATLLDEGQNVAHHHSGLGLLTPHDVHFGLAEQRMAARATVLATAYAAHPERFPRGLPLPPARPEAVWINPPKSPATQETPGLATTRGGLDHARPGQLFSAHRSDLDRRGGLEAPA